LKQQTQTTNQIKKSQKIKQLKKMGRCSMDEWRWEQEDATTIQKITRGFLVRDGRRGVPAVEWDEGFGNVDEIWTMMTQESCSWQCWASEEIQRIYRGYVQRKWWPGIRIKGSVSPPEDTDDKRCCGCRNCNL
jgi:hypothetical protein